MLTSKEAKAIGAKVDGYSDVEAFGDHVVTPVMFSLIGSATTHDLFNVNPYFDPFSLPNATFFYNLSFFSQNLPVTFTISICKLIHCLPLRVSEPPLSNWRQ